MEQGQENIPAREIAVLFSGGRDSSLTVCLLAQQGMLIHLITCDNGVSIANDLSDYRFQEIRTQFPKSIKSRVKLSSVSLFRRVALADIENDFAHFQKNLIILGSQMATHAEAIIHCKRSGLTTVASGFTTYQADYAEQMPQAIDLTREWFAGYGIEYITPVYHYTSADEVKYRLLDFGVSTKSLESFSIFSDTFSQPNPSAVTEYMRKKLHICDEYIRLKLNITTT